MAGCITQNWTVRGISDALENKHIDNKRIVVPMFQRGERWNKKQQQTFIDSLIKGYPVGTLLFYEKYENEQWNYITNYWSEGGTGKIHAAAKPNRYLIPLSGRSWTVALLNLVLPILWRNVRNALLKTLDRTWLS